MFVSPTPPTKPGHKGAGALPHRARMLIPIGLALSLPILALAAIGVGQLQASPTAVMEVLLPGSAPADATLETVVWQLRAPRVLTGLCVGAVLACSGTVLQAVVRNDLADPYLLGISSGASLGAALVIAGGIGPALSSLMGPALGALGAGADEAATTLTTTVGAFLGALAALALVLASSGPRLSGSRLVLAGLAAGYFLSAATNLVVVLSDSRDAVRAVTFWMLGSLGRSSWAGVPALGAVAVLAGGVLTLRARRLDAIALGDDVARSLGVDPYRLRRSTAIVAALAVAAAVAASGAIGFVGLVVPHLARRLVGAGHRLLIPTSALLGALILVGADALARTVLAPREIPLGILTALMGTPLLLLMLHRRRSAQP